MKVKLVELGGSGQLSPATAAAEKAGSTGSSGDSNGWERVAEEAEAVRGRAAEETKAVEEAGSQLEAQLREALAALTEKTEECERTRKALAQSTTDLSEKEDLLQQVAPVIL